MATHSVSLSHGQQVSFHLVSLNMVSKSRQGHTAYLKQSASYHIQVSQLVGCCLTARFSSTARATQLATELGGQQSV